MRGSPNRSTGEVRDGSNRMLRAARVVGVSPCQDFADFRCQPRGAAWEENVLVRRALLLGACLALAACGGGPVVMRNPESGITVKCDAARGDKGLQSCIHDFESQGFQRVP